MNGLDFLKVAPTHVHMSGAASYYDMMQHRYIIALSLNSVGLTKS